MGKKIMTSKFYNLTILIIISLLLTGCASTKGANMKYKLQRTIDNTHPRATLILGSSDLVDNVLLTNVRVGKVGLLNRASVDVQNLTDERYTLEYKFVWRDKQGFPVDETNVWHRFVLTPRKIKTFQTVGKTIEAYSVQFTVRFPDDLYIESDRLDEEAKPFFE
jgi:uncharacterized protein YcfL